MKTQNTKNWRNVAISAAVLLAFCFPMLGKAAGQGGTDLMGFNNCSKRPLSEFLDAQGSSSSFFPPVPDMVGWVDGSFINFGLVDYAGLANAYIEAETGTSLGTTMSGTVTECERRSDGKAKISVVLSTKKALGFAQSIQDIIDNGFNFATTDTIFGNKALDVAGGADPALGPAVLRTTFVIDEAGGVLPDIIDVINNFANYQPITLDFRSTTFETLPDGTKARLRIQQVAATDDSGNLIYTREIVDIASGNNSD